MGEAADQLERRIGEKRLELSAKLHELRYQVRNAIDWRLQVRERPCTMIGLAFAGGVVASFLVKRSRRQRLGTEGVYKTRTSERWNNIKAALGAVAVATAKDLLEEIVPGFGEQYRKREYGSWT
jgi:hypothetical protein